jgi:hypothetical protein
MSQKIKSSLEVLTGIIFIFGYLWLISPLHSQWVQVFSAIPILIFFIYSAFINKKSFEDIGFRMDNWYGSFKILLIFTSITIPILYVIWQFFFPVKSFYYNGYSFWTQLVTKLFEALCQQYIFLAFFFRRYRDIFFPHTNIAIIFSALTFSMIHIPTPPLIIFCFVAGIVWAGTYNKYPNLFTIAISHTVLGIFCSSILLVYTNVGPNADIGRWCKEESVVYGGIDSVNNIDPDNNINTKRHVVDVNINHEKNSIFVNGWVASKDKIKNIRISLGGKDYSVHYGDKRENIAAAFNNPDYLYSGFNANIPISDLALGYHKLILKVYLKGELFSIHYPYPNIWVNLR